MIFASPEYLVFLLIALPLYYLARTHRTRSLVLGCASLCFLAWPGPLPLIVLSSVVFFSWLAADAARRWPAHRSAFVYAGVTVLAAHLFLWKFTPWLGGFWPIGLSYFTLQAIAYLLDYHAGDAEPVSLREYSLYQGFFPKTLAGPITLTNELVPALRSLALPPGRLVVEGLALFSLGLAKRALIAERVAPFVDQVFAQPARYDRFTLFAAALGFMAQLWADFSGYTDMARGTAKMFGIELPPNFFAPYFARSIADFWQRWHATLSRWVRLYLFLPLALRTSGRPIPIAASVVFTMAVVGIWHGPRWTFFAFGFYHGLLLVLERALPNPPLESRRAKAAQFALSLLATQAAVMVGLILFRSPSLSEFADFLLGLFGGAPSRAALPGAPTAIAALAACLLVQFAERFFAGIRARLPAPPLPVALGAAICALSLFAALLWLLGEPPRPFLYFFF